MKQSYILIIALVILVAATIADIADFKKNGGHSGNSIIKNAEESAQDMARNFVEKSVSTYVFDGADLTFLKSVKGECETCFTLSFSFESTHGGYGNREGLLVTQTITPHAIAVEAKDGAVIRAVTDGKYNELTGALAE